MFTVGPVYARDHGPGRFVAGARNWPQGVQEGLIGCPSKMVPGRREQHSPRSLGGLQVRLKVLVAQYI